MSRSKRVLKELEDVANDPISGVTLQLPNESDISHLKGTFNGPPGTPYEGGKYIVDIVIPKDYPFKPPIMKFDTRVYHPNISSQTGAICLDILKDAWTPILTIKSSLISLQSLLQTPEPNDPQDAEVAKVYLSDKKKFDQTAAYWTKVYACVEPETAKDDGTYGIDKGLITTFQQMGFERNKVINALRRLGVKQPLAGPEASELENKILEELFK